MTVGGIGLALTVLVAFALRGVTSEPAKVDTETVEDTRRRSHEELMIAGAALLAAFVIVLVGRDLIIKPEGADQPGAIRLLQLFTYNYRRTWPDSLDFSGVLGGFTIIAALLVLGFAGAVAASPRGGRVLRVRRGVGALGRRRLHGEDVLALGTARGDRGLLQGPEGSR